MDPNLITWCTLAAVVIGACVSVLRPDNTALPIQLPTNLRATLALVLGAVQTCLMAGVGGMPWSQAVVGAVVSVIVGWGAHGAPHVSTGTSPGTATMASKLVPPALLLLLVGSLGFASSGCSLFPGLASKDPVVVAESFEQAAVETYDLVLVAWSIGEPLLPASIQPQAQADFAKAQATYEDALSLLNAGVKGYEDGTAQNWTALLKDVKDAVASIVAIADLYGAKLGSAASPMMSASFATKHAQMHRALATLERY